MANAPATREAASQVSRFPKCSFGVHLNVTQFEPLTGGLGARLLVNERGQMSRANEMARPSPERLRAVYQELCAQVERVASLGVSITHLDSHNHVHTRPLFFPALKEAQRRYNIRRVRLSKNFYSSGQPLPAGLLWKKRTYNWALKSIYRTRTTDAFTELITYYRADAGAKTVDRPDRADGPSRGGRRRRRDRDPRKRLDRSNGSARATDLLRAARLTTDFRATCLCKWVLCD